MKELSEKVRRVIHELEQIREELDRAAAAGPQQEERLRGVQAELNLALLNDFKGSVDLMRHVLWAYIEALTKQKGDRIDRTLQSIRMQRATDMLRALREGETDMALPEATSFLEEIQAMASKAVDRHARRTPTA